MTCPAMHLPSYDLSTAQACAFLANVASDMGQQWISQVNLGKNDDGFDWKPRFDCLITSTRYDIPELSDFEIYSDKIIWSKFEFEPKERLCKGLPGEWLVSPAREPFGFLARRRTDNHYFIAFRGTQTQPDCAIDLTTCMTELGSDSSRGKVHEGFLALTQGMENLGDILGAIPASSLLTLTGHSQGSAVATLTVSLAHDLGLDDTVVVQQYNGASPRVGNQEFVDYYSELRFNGQRVSTYRLVNTFDSVPKIPTKSCQGTRHPGDEPYVHVGIPVEFSADYESAGKNHDPCCSYAYAIFNPENPCNSNFDTCSPPPPEPPQDDV